MNIRKLIRSLFVLLLATSCVESYLPPAGAGEGNQMVIDGFIDGTKNQATVKLSHAVALDDANQNPAESNADVTIVSSSGKEYPLTESSAENQRGIYSASGLVLDPGAKYQLRVTTSAGRSYSSDEISLLQSSSLDSLYWRPTDNFTGINFYVNAHDSENNTRYYRWTFDETAEYFAPLYSIFKKGAGGNPFPRDSGEYVFQCWKTLPSTNIMIESTTRLANDVVSDFPLYFIPKASPKLATSYRMILTQRAISQVEYEFWSLMKKTTESIGGLFDPLPSQVLGNVHSDSDAGEHVLGFFTGGYTRQKTVYVLFSQLPEQLRVGSGEQMQCEVRGVPLAEIPAGVDANEFYIATYGNPVTLGYTVASGPCADCTKSGGTNARPKDWPIF